MIVNIHISDDLQIAKCKLKRVIERGTCSTTDSEQPRKRTAPERLIMEQVEEGRSKKHNTGRVKKFPLPTAPSLHVPLTRKGEELPESSLIVSINDSQADRSYETPYSAAADVSDSTVLEDSISLPFSSSDLPISKCGCHCKHIESKLMVHATS